MSFFRYMFRKSGFGRTTWTEFTAIVAGIIGLLIASVTADEVHVKVTLACFAGLIFAFLMIGTIDNYRRDNPKKRSE